MPKKTDRLILLIGGNLGDRADLLKRCRSLLALLVGEVELCSSIYETAAWGLEDQPAFLNQALQIRTSMSPQAVLQRIGEIERRLGRVRHEKWTARRMDIDILLFGDRVINEPLLNIPHPEMEKRKFALIPAAEIAADVIHPVSRLRLSEILDNCTDKLLVNAFE